MTIMSAIKRAWAALDYVPDCPSCRGAGTPPPERPYDYEDVFWMGRVVRVCWQCKGAGKV